LTIRRIDLFIGHVIGLELKAAPSLEPAHFVQALNYVKAWHFELGLLINFGAPSLQFRRLDNRLFNPTISSENVN